MADCDKGSGICDECQPYPDPDIIRPRCDLTYTDGVFTNATVVVTNGCITEIQSGSPFTYTPPTCCSTTSGGGGSGGQGPKGDKGDKGDSATVTIGTVRTVAYNEPARIENVGTATNARLNFYIPKGEPGSAASGGTFSANRAGFVVKNGLVTDLPMGWTPVSSYMTESDNNGVTAEVSQNKDNGIVTVKINSASLLNTTITNDNDLKSELMELINTLTTRLDEAESEISALEDRVARLEANRP